MAMISKNVNVVIKSTIVCKDFVKEKSFIKRMFMMDALCFHVRFSRRFRIKIHSAFLFYISQVEIWRFLLTGVTVCSFVDNNTVLRCCLQLNFELLHIGVRYKI